MIADKMVNLVNNSSVIRAMFEEGRRLAGIYGAGGFLLSNYQADFYDYFTPGEDIVLYESIDDMLSKCKYYLTHDSERERIAKNGRARIEEAHTYDIRFEEIFNMVFNTHRK